MNPLDYYEDYYEINTEMQEDRGTCADDKTALHYHGRPRSLSSHLSWFVARLRQHALQQQRPLLVLGLLDRPQQHL